MSIESKLNYLFGTKNEIKQAIQEKGVSVPDDTTFRQYADKIRLIETGSTTPPSIELNLQEKTANPTGSQFEVTPDESYDGLSKVIVTGEVNLKPENIAYGVTIYGITGTMESKPIVGGLIPTAYQGYFEQARLLYPGEYEHLMILESDQAVAFGFMLNGFKVDTYSEDSTEFTASKWVYVAYNKKTNQWKVEDWSSSTSNGNSFTKNIRYSDVYIYYGTSVIYPYIVNPTPGMEFTDFEFDVRIEASDVGKDLTFVYSGSGTINYGDGTGDITLPTVAYNETGFSGGVKHAYQSEGEYTVHISGIFSRFASSTAAYIYLPQRISLIRSPFPSSIINLEGFFAGNLYLTTVPENLFEYATKIHNLASFFEEAKIQTVPSSLFFGLNRLTNISRMFYYTLSLGSLPLGLFMNNPVITDVSYFAWSSALNSIPNRIFSNCPNIRDASSAFSKFKGTSLPEIIFSEGISDINLYQLFHTSSKLIEIQPDFLSEVASPTSVEGMFYNAKQVTSALPKFWERDSFVSATHSKCFYGCSNASNYAEVPTGWK